MKNAIVIFVIAFFATNAVAEDWKDPLARFDARKK